ncbi:hypothetical protein CPB86DRAFT_809158 [Serendipita vermifera]|nr:hypothetical protein CPB86DRAFT_809158 [Serendipita vermifera]
MINEWVHDREKPPIFWLSGMAGTGKSTIAKTLSQSLDKPKPEDYLGASFFCSRDDDELSRDHLIIPNIAYQLAQYDERIYSGVAKSLLADPDLADLDIENQFQKLILEPLQNSSTRRTLIVIVLDALDECSGKPEEIVALFANPQLAILPFSVKLFVTGRPEARIRQALSQSHIKSQLQPLQLHEIEHSIVRSDIGLYLSHHFKLVAGMCSHLSRNWPSEADIQALGDLAGDLFIFAATAMKFINNPEEDPKDKLNLILNNVHSSGHIDPLYSQVLGSAFPPNQSDDIKSFQDVMGAVLCLREPLTIQALQMLLGISSSSVRKVVTRLYSVVITPDTDDDYIRLIHPSFPDYLIDERRCTERKYLIKKSINHANLAHCALKCMIKELKRNICNLEDPLTLNEEIGDLSYRLSSYISSQLRYSCFYWASHLCSVDQSKDLLELLHSFATTKLLAWLEVLVLYGRIDIALDSIRSVKLCLFGCSHKSSNTLELLENMERFIKQFSKAIGISSGNIYASALPFTPDCLLSEVYNHERVNSGRIINHNVLKWKSCLSIMRGHMGSILCVTFSPDGSKIVSGSHDQTICIWDSTSCASVSTLKGHSGSVLSVAFSPDGSKIVSGSDDETIRIWNSASGASVATLQGHSGPVWSVAFSPDGSEVVSGSGDQTIRIWDSTSGSLVATLHSHSGPVWSVAFSPDGSKIVSGSSDQTIRIWDPTNGASDMDAKAKHEWMQEWIKTIPTV